MADAHIMDSQKRCRVIVCCRWVSASRASRSRSSRCLFSAWVASLRGSGGQRRRRPGAIAGETGTPVTAVPGAEHWSPGMHSAAQHLPAHARTSDE